MIEDILEYSKSNNRVIKNGNVDMNKVLSAFCKKKINQLGGEIWVSSQVGGGSIFHISIPKVISKKSKTEAIAHELISMN